MSGTKVQNSKVRKCPIFPDLARFSGETGSGQHIGEPLIWDSQRDDEFAPIQICLYSFDVVWFTKTVD